MRWLEDLVAHTPKAGDSVAAWLNPTLASRLEAAVFFTLAQLVERINGVGRRWHAAVKSLGQGKAQRIVEWLQALSNNQRVIGQGQKAREGPLPAGVVGEPARILAS